ncbi:inactive tyrosine-protein kinase 7 isoform X1 [Anolis carolinensis]|uniref:inactive tyrosine-protein kinase 7 isoform X1 n=1 Tax=Anolis carolinensis TaxID=28377 RepID=UPI0004628815|nr:PREDICTED: inactive tyrosine-protein kinase 7 isoform X2 [Anolis carolinensis]|eukprot:XP_003217573.2 PREDICTED: inactive tyrosine-protein kinase 7 isoform X2 [Anolis carolinensis]
MATARAGRGSFFLLLSAFLLAVGAQAKIIFTKEPYSQDALHGRGAILRCEVEDPSDTEFEWLQNGIPVQDTERRFKEGSNLQFTSVDRQQDGGNFQCVARNVVTGEEARTANASFNIKWIDTGGVVLKNPARVDDIQSSAPVVLRCHIDGHPRPTSQWFRDGTQVIDDRTIYSVSNKERTLTLKSASPDDNGIYYCCARNAVGFVCSNNNFTLNIIDESFPRPVVVPENQIVNRNEEAMFHCKFQAVPPPTQEWLFEDTPVSNQSRTVVFSNGSILITQVKRRSAGVYKCVARGQRGKPVVLEATLQLAEIEDFPHLFEPKTFIANREQRVTCVAPRGVPEPRIWWERNNVQIPTTGRVRQEAEDLVFSSIVEKDGGQYTCHAANKAGEKTQNLIITVATMPRWVEKPKESRLEEGKPGYLHCLSEASLKPIVSWFRNGNPVSEDSRFEIAENGTLRINSVEVYDGTVFKCVSSTPAGSIEEQARVFVLEKLKFTPPPQPLQCVEFDKEATVSCSATGREKPTIQWIKSDGSSLPNWVHHSGGNLHFQKVTRNDAGNYTCIASNSPQGEIRATVQLTVAVFISFKLKPDDTTVYSGHTAMFQCQAEGDPVPHIQWKGKDRIVEPDKFLPRIQIMSNGSLVIYDVTTEDSGKYTCIAGNSCNIKHHEAFLHVVDKPMTEGDTSNSHTPYKMIQTIGLSVGAAVAYIIIVLGLMFYCKKRRKAKRLKKQPEGEEPEMECLNGGTLMQNGQTTAEIQEEVALNNLGSSSAASKRHSAGDKMHFPRSNLQTITPLGKGEFGEVFLAKAKGIEDNETEMLVLVKSLQTRDEQLQLDFRREFEMFGKLNHSNVVRLLGLCREAEPHYMILEYVDLGDLKQFLRISRSKDEKLKPQPISTKQKVSFCCQVALGMEHLSNNRFIHKDLAARNCLVSAQRQVKVSSLSLSKDVYNSEYYHYHQTWIPLRWMPPEAALEDEFSTKSDVWSFGVVMWEIFTLGEMPYSKLADEEVLAGLQSGKMKLPHPEGCPSKLYKLMQRCWSASPKDRPSFSEIANMLGESPSESKA